MPKEEFVQQVKAIAKQIPGIQWVNGIRHKILRLHEISQMIKNGKIVVLGLPSESENDFTARKAVVQEIVKEWLDLYGIIHMSRETVMAIGARNGASLLYAPQALLRIPGSHEEYLKGVERETRRLIRLAEKNGYEFKTFTWNDYIDDIFEINISKEVRQFEQMRGWYREPVQQRYHSEEELRYRKYYGAFKNGKLYGYFHFYLCGGVAIGKHFIGHAEHLRYGIMNGLISCVVREYTNSSQMLWLNYGEWQKKGSLNAFKKHAGFQGYAILLELGNEKELLECSRRNVRTIWRL
jgi:hypothetical protein